MTPREIRRIGLLALALLLLPQACWTVPAMLGTIELARGDVVWGLVLIILCSLPLLCVVLLVWTAMRRSARAGRALGPSTMVGAPLLGCVAIRVICLWVFYACILPFASGLQGTAEAIPYAVGLSPLAMIVSGFSLPVAALLLFFAAPWISRWVVGQVDSGVMWWMPFVRWLKR
jgi:hypothetical protein